MTSNEADEMSFGKAQRNFSNVLGSAVVVTVRRSVTKHSSHTSQPRGLKMKLIATLYNPHGGKFK